MTRKHIAIPAIVAGILLIFAITAKLDEGEKRLSDLPVESNRTEATSTAAEKLPPLTSEAIVPMKSLHAAVAGGNIKEINALISKGANVNEKDAVDGRGPLYTAVADSHVDVARLLISKGASINSQDKLGMTPLHAAVLANQQEMVALLLDKGARVDLRDVDGLSPVDMALRSGQYEMVQLLQR